MTDREILEEIRDHMRRGNELMSEVVREHQLNREAYAQSLELLAGVIDRNATAFQGLMGELGRFGDRVDRFGERIDSFGERVDSFGERIASFGERVDSFGATLEIQREILLRFLDRLDEREPPQG